MKLSIYVIWIFLLSITNVTYEKTPEEKKTTWLVCHWDVINKNNGYR
jgi:hypothetical protein